MKRFDGKVVVIAGGSGGIGSSVSKRLAKEGATVVIGDIDLGKAEQTAAEIEAEDGRAIALRLDIADEDSVESFVQNAVDMHGGIDGFHANALDSRFANSDLDAVSSDMSVYDNMMHANLRGYYLCTRHAVPHLVARGGGSMLYTSSASAYAGTEDRPVYAMVKSGIHALARHVASRWGKQGVRSNVIAPGVIFHAAVAAVMGEQYGEEVLKSLKVCRIGKPEDIAAMAALLMSDEGGFITGQVISVDGGATMRP